MMTHPTRGRVRAAAAALCGITAIATAACAAQAPHANATPHASATTQANANATAQRPLAAAADAAATSVPVVVDCAVHGQTRPGQYNLACAGGGAYLSGLHWASWGASAAFAEGFSTINDCVPSCVGGHGHTFPVLVTLWRAEPRPGHAGQRYFTRLTVIYTGSRTYSAGGTPHQLPVTATDPLSPYGGA
jgi:hypothetical protein